MKKFAKILLTCLVLLLALVAILLGYSEWRISDARHYTYDKVEDVPYHRVAVVLGTSRYRSSGGPNPYFKNRIKAAAELYNHGKVDFILVSGDNATLQYNEPRQMRRALIKAGLPASAIYMDFAGFRTLDSVVRAKEVFGQQRFIVVSQGFHNERAIFIARHFGIEAVGFNAEAPNAYQGIRTRVREVFARLIGLIDLYVLDKAPKFLGEPVHIGLPQPCQTLSTIGSQQPCLTQSALAVTQTKPAVISAAVAKSATLAASAATAAKQLTPNAAASAEPPTAVSLTLPLAPPLPSSAAP